jgi:hypothetical protein
MEYRTEEDNVMDIEMFYVYREIEPKAHCSGVRGGF